MYIVPYLLPHCVGQEFFAVEVAANALVSSNESCMRLIRQGARALYNDSYPNGMTHLCRLPTQIPMKWWPRETLRAGEVVHILGECCLFTCKALPFAWVTWCGIWICYTCRRWQESMIAQKVAPGLLVVAF